MKTLILIATAFLSIYSHASTLRDADIVAEVQQRVNDGVVTSCGVTLFGIETIKAPSRQELHAFNGSVVMSAHAGIVKGRPALALIDPSKPPEKVFSLKPRVADSLWLKAGNLKATTPLDGKGLKPSEDPGYKLYIISFEDAANILMSVIMKAPIQIHSNSKDMNKDITLIGTVQIEESQLGHLRSCITELTEVEL